jgi:predicted lactoylglutathione lyase
MEQRISIITLGVADLNSSREFYERLGWRCSMAASEGIVFFQAGGMALAFHRMTLAYNARDRGEVDSVLEEAKASGAKILKPALEAFWGGYSGYFSDPDGFLWEVAWNPFFVIEDDGGIRLPE